MGRHNLRVSPLRPGGEAAFSAELNRLLGSISDLFSRVEGRDGHTASLSGDLDLGGHRLRNVGRPADGAHVVTVEDARDFGMYLTDGDEHVADKPILAKRGVRLMDSPSDDQQAAVSIRRLRGRLSDGQAADLNARVAFQNEDALVGTRRALNFHAGANVALTVVDDPLGERVDITIDSTASGSGGFGGLTAVRETIVGPAATAVLATTPSTDSERVTVETTPLSRGPGAAGYTIAGATVTFGTALLAGETAVVQYWTPFGEVYKEEFVGPAATLALAAAPLVDSEVLAIETVEQRRVAAAPVTNEYTLSGSTATLGVALLAGEVAWITYWTAAPSAGPHLQSFTGPLATLTLAQTPVADSEVVVVDGRHQRLVPAAPGLNAYTIAGAVLTPGGGLAAGETAWVTYWAL